MIQMMLILYPRFCLPFCNRKAYIPSASFYFDTFLFVPNYLFTLNEMINILVDVLVQFYSLVNHL